MKLNNTQIKALAQEVYNKIPDTKKEFTKEQLAFFTPIVKEINKLDKESDTIDKKISELVNKIYDTNSFNKLYHSNCRDLKQMLSKLIVKNEKPSLEEIIHKITLETIFETKDSMNDFIDNLVKQYTK